MRRWLLQDGALAHFSRPVRDVLNSVYHDKWIGRLGPVTWYPRSRYHNPSDFYLWRTLKIIVYSAPNQIEERLCWRIFWRLSNNSQPLRVMWKGVAIYDKMCPRLHLFRWKGLGVYVINSRLLNWEQVLRMCYASLRQACCSCGGSALLRVIPLTTGLRNHTQTHHTQRTHLVEWPARNRDLYLTKHSTLKTQTSMPQAVFEPTITVSEFQQTYHLDRVATGSGNKILHN